MVYSLKAKMGTTYTNFDTKQPFSPQDNVVYKIVTSSAQFDCEYVSSDNCQVLLKTFRPLSLSQEIKLFLDRTALPEKLLQCFQENLHNADQRYAIAARLFNGQFQAGTKIFTGLSGI